MPVMCPSKIMRGGSVILLVIFNLIPSYNSYEASHPSCIFNALCTCSKAVPDLGIVSCIDVPLPRLPAHVNTSRVNDLILKNNGLHNVDPNFLSKTGLYTLTITKNPIYMISDEAFSGLDHSLRTLELSYIRLREVPNRAIRHLQKLKVLDLSGNEISEINSESWKGVKSRIEILILRENAIFHIPKMTFSDFDRLETLDLSGNVLWNIELDAFIPPPKKLTYVSFSNNQLRYIPYHQLAPIKGLRTLDLSSNLISDINGLLDGGGRSLLSKLSVYTLHLQHNQIDSLSESSFQLFGFVNRTYLDGNPIYSIQSKSFSSIRASEISLVDCGLSFIAEDAFKGLEKTLQFVDLSSNNLTILPRDLFASFELLREFNIRDNIMKNINVFPTLKNSPVQRLNLRGLNDESISFLELSRLRNIQSLSLSKISSQTLTPELFENFGSDLSELSITNAGLKGIKSDAFAHTRGVRKLDLSDNDITAMDNTAFFEVGHTLIWISMCHAFSSSVRTIPADSLKYLTRIRYIDMSHNAFDLIPDTTFNSMNDVEIILLNDNRIKSINSATFQNDLNPKLSEIIMSYNSLTVIKSETFVDLKELNNLDLKDNQITTIERRAFVNLENLKYLQLRGNKITSIEDEAFINIPKLQKLDLAYNNLKTLNFLAFDQVGTMSSFCLNVSHNSLRNLYGNDSYTDRDYVINANIKVLDVTYNNITNVIPGYFKPLESSLTHLYFSHNSLFNMTRETFGNLFQLQWLDISWNSLHDIDFSTFKNIHELQILDLSHNVLTDIPSGLFQALRNLRIVDFSHNKIHALPEYLFRDDSLEKLSLSFNSLTSIPIKTYSMDAAANLCEFYLSHNALSRLHNPEFFSHFKSLISFDLSGNRLSRLEDSIFGQMPRIQHLDLSHNYPLQLEEKGRSFNGLENSLLSLKLQNISLHAMPELSLRSLLILDISKNKIRNILPEMANNLTSIYELDISDNELKTIPLVVLSFPNLKNLFINNNEISSLTNVTIFSSNEQLRILDISNLPLRVFETGSLAKLACLDKLHISTYPLVNKFNIPAILENNHVLRHLQITVEDRSNIDEEMRGKFNPKLGNITIVGNQLKSLNHIALEGVRAVKFSLTLRNTSIERLSSSLFHNMHSVRNISLDLRNNSLKVLENPSNGKYPGIPNKMFLINADISGNRWVCKCDIGWVEMWQRKVRQYLRNRLDNVENDSEDIVRETTCEDKGVSLSDILKQDLECGWNGAPIVSNSFTKITALIVIFTTIFNYFGY